ncbi:HD-GYP domain-containing protein [Sporosalibacterium faouarense]|uniref:HD-GYP domain-containing protein n=1 Tax=Sporosalibacterium faouarense TaxID=516123 RepID=UPI00192BEA43|nr:HD domain-containing phosphohydrolase [Sporosalibacterium faouarense]
MRVLKDKELNVNLSQLLFAFSLALDIAENRNFEHSRRTAYISYNIAKHIGLNEDKLNNIFYAALIHDIGMTGQLSSYTIKEIHYKSKLKEEHCFLGSQIAEKLPLSDDISKYILYHHESWDGSGVYGLKGDEIPIESQIINLADSFDIDNCNILETKLGRENFGKWLERKSGQASNPLLVKVLGEIAEQDKFWFDIKFHNMHQLLNMIMPKEEKIINMDDLKRIADAFALLIDNKSKFTHRHSRGVAKISRKMAEYLKYSSNEIEKVEIAGLLHDLGKLVVPNEILEKSSKLTKEEFEVIKSHPYYTKIILQQINGLEDIAEWAGNHHEKLNGKGYPEKLDAIRMTNEDQILAVADIYQALTEDRPYRGGMSRNKAMEILKSMGKDGFISKKMIEILDNVV